MKEILITLLLFIIISTGYLLSINTQEINIKNFMPTQNNYLYETVITNGSKTNELRTQSNVSNRNGECIEYTSYYIDDKDKYLKLNQKELEIFRVVKEEYCVNENTISLNGLVIFNKNETFLDFCKFISLKNKFILGKNRNVLHTKCNYLIFGKAEHTDWYFAEDLGIIHHSLTRGFNYTRTELTKI